MKKYLNTLFVTTQDAYLSKDGETVLVKVGDETRIQVPIHTLSSIVCFGHVTCTPFLFGLCCEHDVSVSFMTEYGRFLARVQGPVSGNVLLRREQYRKADDLKFSAGVARSILLGKLSNSRTVIGRAARDHSDKVDGPKIQRVMTRLKGYIDGLSEDLELDVLRGMEGDSAHAYFSVFDDMITSQKEDFFFKERSRRPPLDNINCLLSFLYTLLMHDVRSAFETVGLDPAVGYLHRDRPGRPGLALDIMEEFRPFIADRLALSLVNLAQVNKKGFKKSASGAVTMDDATRKEVLIAYQKRKKEE
ncbi:MAG: type I-C CRISPR-associated endonuclease Cas1c, partial [Candidatus Omnitrophota bacterium]